MGLGSLWSLRVLVGERAVMKMRSLMSEEGRLLVMLWWRSVRVNWLMNVVSEGHVHEENSWYHVKGGGGQIIRWRERRGEVAGVKSTVVDRTF